MHSYSQPSSQVLVGQHLGTRLSYSICNLDQSSYPDTHRAMLNACIRGFLCEGKLTAELKIVFSLPLSPFSPALQLVVSKFFICLLTLFMISLSSASIMYAYSSLTSVTAVATLLSALTFVLSMVVTLIPCSIQPGHIHVHPHFVQLFGGFFIALDSLPVWLRWIKYLSLFRYGLEVGDMAVCVCLHCQIFLLLMYICVHVCMCRLSALMRQLVNSTILIQPTLRTCYGKWRLREGGREGGREVGQ